MKYVLALGNFGDGFYFIGPFDSMEAAFEWSDENPRDREDTVTAMPLLDPAAVVDWNNE